MIDSLKVPKETVETIKKIKHEIEKGTGTKIRIDDCEIIIDGDTLNSYNAQRIIKAVARGFPPKDALRLAKDETCFEIIEIRDFGGKTRNDLVRLRGRIIGEKGKAKRNIENLTNTSISVSGKTVGIIGEVEGVMEAKEAVTSLLQGSKHGTAYKLIERKKVFKKE